QIGIAPRTEWEGPHLPLDRFDHARIGKAHMVHVVAVEIEKAPAREVFDPAAFASRQYVQTGRRERLPQKVARVLIEPAAGGAVEIAFPPGAVRREIEIALGLERASTLVHGLQFRAARRARFAPIFRLPPARGPRWNRSRNAGGTPRDGGAPAQRVPPAR